MPPASPLAFCHEILDVKYTRDFPVGSVVKNPPANTGDIEDVGSILGVGRSLEEEMATHSSITAWEIPRAEEPGRLRSKGVTKSDTTE